MAMTIGPVDGPHEYPRLVEIWRSAIDATHDFLDDGYRDEIQSQLAVAYFPQVSLYGAEQDGELVGFAGVHGSSLEMLFVDDSVRGQGVGSALLAHVIAEHAVSVLEVNEQNRQALGFYEHHGFVVESRSEVDSQGKAYPILHMKKQEPST